jgi:uncharacterized protein
MALFRRMAKRGEEFLGLAHHDKFHTERVFNLAVRIGGEERADLDVIRASALLHDIARALEDEGKVRDHAVEGAKMARKILEELDFPEEKIGQVAYCIEVHRFRDGVKPDSLEAKILQDADRLDVIGAIGVARVFTRSGWENLPIHDPSTPPKERYDGQSLTAVNHIHEKLLKIKDALNTDTAKRIAEERHKFVEEYLERFIKDGVLTFDYGLIVRGHSTIS